MRAKQATGHILGKLEIKKLFDRINHDRNLTSQELWELAEKHIEPIVQQAIDDAIAYERLKVSNLEAVNTRLQAELEAARKTAEHHQLDARHMAAEVDRMWTDVPRVVLEDVLAILADELHYAESDFVLDYHLMATLKTVVTKIKALKESCK